MNAQSHFGDLQHQKHSLCSSTTHLTRLIRRLSYPLPSSTRLIRHLSTKRRWCSRNSKSYPAEYWSSTPTRCKPNFLPFTLRVALPGDLTCSGCFLSSINKQTLYFPRLRQVLCASPSLAQQWPVACSPRLPNRWHDTRGRHTYPMQLVWSLQFRTKVCGLQLLVV